MELTTEYVPCTSLTGVVKVVKENTTVSLKSAIRDIVTKGLRTYHAPCTYHVVLNAFNADTILMEERGVKEDALPLHMNWARYETLCVVYGIELKGWTGPDGVCNPDKLRGIAELQKLKNALDDRKCFWTVLTGEEWTAKKAANNAHVASKAKGKGKATAANLASVAMDVDNNVPDIVQAGASVSGFIFPPTVPPIPATSWSGQEFAQGSSTGWQGW